MDSVPDWSDLLTDLLAEIATKLSFIEDFTAFRGVCTSWRAAATKDRFVSASKIPLLMLPGKAIISSSVREFFSLYKRKICSRILVPETKSNICIGAGFEWILTRGIWNNGELHLVKLMSSAKIQLPTIVSENSYIAHAVLSANPSETSNFMLMVDVGHVRLDFWRNGDSHWTKIEMKTNPPQCPNFCYYKNKMYVTDFPGNVWMWDPYLPKSPAEIILTVDNGSSLLCGILENAYLVESHAYLVESSKGELLRIMRATVYSSDSTSSCALYFGIVQIDTVKRASRVIEHLDQDAIFLGKHSALSVDATDHFPGIIKANHIYYIDSERCFNPSSKGGKDTVGIYNVQDKSTERFDVSFSFMDPPFWVFPTSL